MADHAQAALMITRRNTLAIAAASLAPIPARAERIRPASVYGMKGEELTCERGHLAAVFARDVLRGETASPSQLTWPTGYTPLPGTTVQPCGCGAPIFRTGDWRFQAHFRDGWR